MEDDEHEQQNTDDMTGANLIHKNQDGDMKPESVEMMGMGISNVLKHNEVQVSVSNAVDPSKVIPAVLDLHQIY